MFLYQQRINAMTCSATALAFTPAALHTWTPCFVHARKSTLSYPAPVCTNFSLGAFCRISSSIRMCSGINTSASVNSCSTSSGKTILTSQVHGKFPRILSFAFSGKKPMMTTFIEHIPPANPAFMGSPVTPKNKPARDSTTLTRLFSQQQTNIICIDGIKCRDLQSRKSC